MISSKRVILLHISPNNRKLKKSNPMKDNWENRNKKFLNICLELMKTFRLIVRTS